MLSRDSLKNFSRERGLPPGKLKGAVREYAQILALRALYIGPSAAGLVLVGDAALRFGWDLPRFSEDLEFCTFGLSAAEWKKLVDETVRRLELFGVEVEAKTGEKGPLLTGELRFLNILQAFGAAAEPKEKLVVKIEVNRPRYRLKAESKNINAYGEMFSVPLASPELLAAEAAACLVSRELGRDVYDLMFLAGKKWKPDPDVLATKGLDDPRGAVQLRLEQWGPAGLAGLAARFKPSLFRPEEASLVADAAKLLPQAMETWKPRPGTARQPARSARS
jgi:hypothetical protein